MKSRIPFLDSLRGLSALGVMLFHYTEINNTMFIPPFSYGYMGVRLFFIISGFVIFMSISHINSTKDFIINRFSRLFPGYWFNVLISFISAYLLLNNDQINFTTLLINLTMLQHWLVTPHIDGVYWTLTVELNFYILMGLLLYFKKLHRINFFSYIFLILMFVAKAISSYSSIPVYYALQLFHWGHLFIAGIVFYKIYEKKVAMSDYFLLLLTLATQFLLGDNLTESYIILAFYAIFYILVTTELKSKKYNALAFLGTISYPLYLVHNVNGTMLFKTLSFIPSFFMKITLISVIMIIAATLITYYIEKPFQRIIRNKFSGFAIKAR